MKSKLLVFWVFTFVLILFGDNLFSQPNDFSAAGQIGQFTSSNLPIIIINTHGKQILNEPKIEADMGIIYNGEGNRNNITDPTNDFSGKIGIEIRGSSSQMFPKKQYGIEITDSNGNDLDVSLLGFPKESDWILYAPYTDKSLIRDVLVYKLWNNLGRYATRSKYCELILNGEYMGIYVLFEKIKRNKNRVNISKMTPEDTSGNNLSGGYIIKIDKNDGSGNAGWNSDFVPFTGAYQRIYYQYDYPDPDYITSAQKLYIQKFIRAFESTMSLPGFSDPVNGYAKFIDVNSFVDYCLMNELSKNVDAYRLSLFMHKDRDSINDKLKIGPIWDYNFAFGNSDYYDASLTEGFHITYLTNNSSYKNYDQYQPPFWWKKLMDEPEFKKKLNARWNELRKNELSQEKIFSYIDSLTSLLEEASVRNFEKWNVLGRYVWPNYFIGNTYGEEINYLNEWIEARISWMDLQFPPVTSVIKENEEITGFYLLQNYPNPFNSVTKIRYSIGAEGHATLKIYDLLGNEIITLLNEKKLPGEYEVEFDIREEGTGMRSLSSAVYFYKLTAGGFSQAKKFIVIK